MTENTKLLNEKEQLIEAITEQLNSWDSSAEQAIEIINRNNETFQQLAVVDQQIPEDLLIEFNQNHQEQWEELLNTHQKLVQKIQGEQINVQKQLKQISNKEKVVTGYMELKNKSMFVEKNY